MAPKTLEERWKEEGEGLRVIDDEADPFLEDDSDLELDDEEDDSDD